MASEQARDLRERGIQAAKAGQKELARDLLLKSLRLDSQNEAAWLWLASVSRDRRERLFCLQNLLKINPNNGAGLKALQALGVSPESSVPAKSPEPPPKPAAPARPAAPPAPSKPTPPAPPPARPAPPPAPAADDTDGLEAIIAQAESVVQAYLTLPPAENFTWVRKTKRRAGERDILVLRLQVFGAIVAFLVVIGLLGVLFVATNPDAQALLFAPTWTPSFTPTVTATFTPGIPPTASPTLDATRFPTYTPTPTIEAAIPTGNPDPDSRPRATALHLPLPLEKVIVDSAEMLEQGKADDVVLTLDAVRLQQQASLDVNTYYYLALGFLQKGDTEQALKTLDEAQDRTSQVSADQLRPIQAVINAGYAEVNLELARQAVAAKNARNTAAYLAIVQTRAQAVLTADPEFARAYLLLSRRFSLDKKPDQALQALTNGLSLPNLSADLTLRLERATLYFQQGNYPAAAQEAYYILYIDPHSRPAYTLVVRSVLAQGQAGLAVIYAEKFLFYFPNDVEGLKLLGDARTAEGNIELALEKYSLALQGDKNDPLYAEVLVARATLYREQRHYALALDDLNAALAIRKTPEVQALRMYVAYEGGNFVAARKDTDELLNSEVVPNAELQLLKARILIDEAPLGATDQFSEALLLLNTASAGLSDALRPIAEEYRARANYGVGDYEAALNAVNVALRAGETGRRHFLRGQILEARASIPESKTADADRAEAKREYEWVLTWGQVYAYPFLSDAQQALDRLNAPPPEVTPVPGEEPTPTPESG